MNPEHLAWRKSSHSNGTGGNNCVEVASSPDGVAIRDSKYFIGDRHPQIRAAKADWQMLNDTLAKQTLRRNTVR